MGTEIIQQFDRVPDMYFDGPRRQWVLRFLLQDVIDYLSVKTTVDSEGDGTMPIKKVFTDKDRDLVLVFMRGAVSNVNMMLARRMLQPAEVNPDFVTFRLEVSENHDDNMTRILFSRIMDYLCEYVYIRWVGGDPQALSKMEDSIRSAMHYRKHFILRRTRNLL